MAQEELGQAIIKICKDFQEFFEKEVPDQPIKCIDWIREILDMTREVVQDSKEQLERQTLQYEKMLQSSEKEVRTHIRIEQQLRLHIENLQQKIEDCERKHPKQIEGLKLQIDSFRKKGIQLKQYQQKVEPYQNNYLSQREETKNSNEQDTDRLKKSAKIQNSHSKIELHSQQKSKQAQILEVDNRRLKQQLKERNKNLKKLKSESNQQATKNKQLVHSSSIKKQFNDTSENLRKSLTQTQQKSYTLVKKYNSIVHHHSGSLTERQSYDGALNAVKQIQLKQSMNKQQQIPNRGTLKVQNGSYTQKQRAKSASRIDLNQVTGSYSYNYQNNIKAKATTAGLQKKNTNK